MDGCCGIPEYVNTGSGDSLCFLLDLDVYMYSIVSIMTDSQFEECLMQE